MGQSLSKNCVHIIFSTKHRKPLLYPAVRKDLFKYLAGICQGMECNPIQVGGYSDHIHILCVLSKKIALMNLVKEIKANSSIWLKTQNPRLKNFYWQDGYGAFSVNPTQLNLVDNYIRNQEEHHKQQDFKTELKTFLKKYQIPFDEQYLWD